MVFQNPDSTLNPSHTVGYALQRTVQRLENLPREAARDRVRQMLEIVRLPADHEGRYPDQLSGGQKQRVAIARSLVGNPEVVIADEPVSALDVSVQAAIINLLNDLQDEYATTLNLHIPRLSVVRYLADTVAVMYLGQVVEFGPAEAVFRPPFHPYTEALLSAVPSLSRARTAGASCVRTRSGTRMSRARDAPSRPAAREKSVLFARTNPPRRDFESTHYLTCHMAPRDLLDSHRGLTRDSQCAVKGAFCHDGRAQRAECNHLLQCEAAPKASP